jgi:hypothetical protein
MSDVLDREARAMRAAALLDNETFRDALTAIEASAVDALASASVADPAALIEHTALLQAVRAVRQHVESIATNGALSVRPGPAVA